MFQSIDIDPTDRTDVINNDYENFVSLYHYFFVCFMTYKTFNNPGRVGYITSLITHNGHQSFIQSVLISTIIIVLKVMW